MTFILLKTIQSIDEKEWTTDVLFDNDVSLGDTVEFHNSRSEWKFEGRDSKSATHKFSISYSMASIYPRNVKAFERYEVVRNNN